jgi:tryptophan synthase alpha chain
MKRIREAFERTREDGGALIIYLTAGDPSLALTEELALAAERGGADLVELGIPYSDPLADGPTIQAASQRALTGGTTVAGVLECAARVRSASGIPLVIMTCYNPILQFGTGDFARAAAEQGESDDWCQAAAKHGLGTVFLVAPTNDDEYLDQALARTTGFCYAISRPGVTGARDDLPADLAGFVGRVKARAQVPVAVGFGISNAEQVQAVLQVADGAVVGSAIVDLIAEGNEDGRLPDRVERAVRALRG